MSVDRRTTITCLLPSRCMLSYDVRHQKGKRCNEENAQYSKSMVESVTLMKALIDFVGHMCIKSRVMNT